MNKKKIGMVIGIFLLIEGGLTLSMASGELKVGCVDIQRAMNECQAGIEAKKVIGKEMEKLQKLFAEKQKELQTLKESLDKQAPMMKPEARAAKEKEFQTKVRDYQRWLEDNQKEIQQRGMELEQTILQGVRKVIKKIGEEEGYTLVLEMNENIVLYSSKTIDFTDRVIKTYDAQMK
ncbi:MAG: OmpH family outer membrane protein [Thermodesulfobacteriota bacterium]